MELINIKWSRLSDSRGMTTPWEVIEQALARKKPPRGAKWLADELGESIQTVSNWKVRGVPFRRFRQIADAIGLTVDQLEGLQPLPWERLPEGSDWPFSDELLQKCLTLSADGLYRLETVMRAHLGMPAAGQARGILQIDERATPPVTAERLYAQESEKVKGVSPPHPLKSGTSLVEGSALATVVGRLEGKKKRASGKSGAVPKSRVGRRL